MMIELYNPITDEFECIGVIDPINVHQSILQGVLPVQASK